jgi:SanA protein
VRPKLKKAIWRWLLFAAGVFVLLVLLANRWVINSTDAYIFDNWSLLPENDFGIVLGTSAYTRSGKPNPHFQGRIRAAVELYQIGKVKHLIVSGANPDSTYNEPRKMWQELTKAGVPATDITMDFAGFRTFDSVIRAQEVFGLQRATLITQKYHAYRAVFIGKKLGMRGIVAYAAPGDEPGIDLRLHLREWMARFRAVLDIFLLNTEPKFLGEPVNVEAT